MPINSEASTCLDTLRCSSTGDSEALAAIRGLTSVTRSGIEFDEACAILETVSCHPPKEIFGDSVHGSFPLDEAAASRYVLRAVATLELQLTAVRYLEHIRLPEPPRPRTFDAPIIEDISQEDSQPGIDVSSIILSCLLHASSTPSADPILVPTTAWANDSTTQRAHDILVALSDRSVGDAKRCAYRRQFERIPMSPFHVCNHFIFRIRLYQVFCLEAPHFLLPCSRGALLCVSFMRVVSPQHAVNESKTLARFMMSSTCTSSRS